MVFKMKMVYLNFFKEERRDSFFFFWEIFVTFVSFRGLILGFEEVMVIC